MSEVAHIASLVTAVVAVVALIGGYVQFVPRTWLLPSVEFDADFTRLCDDREGGICEVACLITNTGANLLVVPGSGAACPTASPLTGDG